jgi:hypothetical protein
MAVEASKWMDAEGAQKDCPADGIRSGRDIPSNGHLRGDRHLWSADWHPGHCVAWSAIPQNAARTYVDAGRLGHRWRQGGFGRVVAGRSENRGRLKGKEALSILRFFLLLTVLTCGLMAGGTEAIAYHLIGVGLSSCGTWTTDRRNPSAQLALMDASWISGFLSGIGYVGEGGADPLKGMDANGVAAWVDNFCRAHPIDDIATAAEAFVREHPR